MKGTRISIVAAVVMLFIAVVVMFYYVLLPWANIDTVGIKKELPAATGQLGFHHGSEFINGLYQIPEVISNDR